MQRDLKTLRGWHEAGEALKEEGLLVIPLSRRSRDKVSRHGLRSDPATVNGAVGMAVY